MRVASASVDSSPEPLTSVCNGKSDHVHKRHCASSEQSINCNFIELKSENVQGCTCSAGAAIRK